MHVEPIHDAPGIVPTPQALAPEPLPERRSAAPAPEPADSVAFSPTAQALAQAAFSEDPRRFISDEKGPPYLRMGPLGPIYVRSNGATN